MLILYDVYNAASAFTSLQVQYRCIVTTSSTITMFVVVRKHLTLPSSGCLAV